MAPLKAKWSFDLKSCFHVANTFKAATMYNWITRGSFNVPDNHHKEVLKKLHLGQVEQRNHQSVLISEVSYES